MIDVLFTFIYIIKVPIGIHTLVSATQAVRTKLHQCLIIKRKFNILDKLDITF